MTERRPRKPPSKRIFLAGATGSGKSYSAWNVYLKHAPRVILVDPMDEWSDPDPESGFPGTDASVWGVQEFSQALRDLAPRGKWRITVSLEDWEFKPLIDYLIPIPNVKESPVLMVGGCVILVDEVDLVAPSHTQKIEARTLWRRSRHAGLSVLATTQRPESVSRETSSQNQEMLCLALVEPTAYDYMERAMHVQLRPQLIDWIAKHPHGGLWRDMRTGVVRWYDGANFRPAQVPRLVERAQGSGSLVQDPPLEDADDADDGAGALRPVRAPA